MTQLAHLRGQLIALKNRRRAVRWGVALAAVAIAILWALIALFAVDVALHMTWVQRLVAMVVAAGGVVWAVRKYALPWLGQEESELDMALLVEKHQKIDTSDLVAALQFESPDAAAWGSRQLEVAVIDYVAEFSRGWNVFDGFSMQQLGRRSAVLLATLVVVALGAVLMPGHVRTFFQRMALGSQHYPTKTQIVRIEINGQAGRDKSAYGEAVKFRVVGGGELPETGRIEIRTLNTNVKGRDIELVRVVASGDKPTADKPAADVASAASTESEPTTEAHYVGELPQLLDAVEYQVFLGDAWTDPAQLRVIALPVIELKVVTTPPDYALSATSEPETQAGVRLLSVIEGSRVDLEVLSTNKSLRSAELEVGGKSYPLTRKSPYAATNDARGNPSAERWLLPTAGTPLAEIHEPLSYQVVVIDEDGLKLENPISGSIRIKTDRKPTVTAEIRMTHYLPTAAPKIRYTATDDYGIAKMQLQVELLRKSQESSAAGAVPDVVVESTVPVLAPAKPVLAASLPLKDTFSLNLTPYKLAKGDQVRLVLQVIDYRGRHEGRTSSSEPLLLNITDESGVHAAIAESDERTARQMDAILKLQTGGNK